MQTRLGPLLAAALLSGSTAAWIYGAPRSPYRGFFIQRDQVERLFRVADPTVRLESSGGGSGASTSDCFVSHYTHTLSSRQTINKEYVAALRARILEELRRRGIKAESHMSVIDGDKAHVYGTGFRQVTRVFQVTFEEDGFRGVFTVRLKSRFFPVGSYQHLAELFETVAVFPRN